MTTHITRKHIQRISRAFNGVLEDTLYIVSPGLKERVTVSVTSQKVLRRKSEHGPAPVVITYWRQEDGHGERSRNYESVEEFLEDLHG